MQNVSKSKGTLILYYAELSQVHLLIYYHVEKLSKVLLYVKLYLIIVGEYLHYQSSKVHIMLHGSALVGSDPHELAPRFEVCQMKGTHIGTLKLTFFKSYEIRFLRIRPLCFWPIK